MKVVFTPRDGVRREWPFDPDDIEMVDASFIKKQTHLTHGEWKQALLEQDADALHGLLWVLHKQDSPLFRWADVRFRMNEVSFEFDDAEVDVIVDQLASMSPEDAADPDVASLRAMLESQGVDVSARIVARMGDPEFQPDIVDPAPVVVSDPKV